MRILALNCGSSSIKSALIDSIEDRRLLDIRIERIGTANGSISIDGVVQEMQGSADLDVAVKRLLREWRDRSQKLGRPAAVAHRIVHGGEKFLRPVVVTDDVLRQLEQLNPLAPLHNPPALAAIRLTRAELADVPQVAVFDTAYHATLPKRAREYALPADLRKRLGIRRYGFHGISHAHVMRSVADHLRVEPQDLRIVSCHLGNGASVTAIEYGRSVETSMGMTPLEGLVMGTRAGDVDPGVLLHVLRHEGGGAKELDELLNTRSGLVGLTGTNDMQQIERRAAEGDEDCRLAITLYSHRIRKYIGAYAAVMGGVDVIAFTGGIGENSALIRHRCTQRLEFLGAVLDEDLNRDARSGLNEPLVEISEARSRSRLVVVRADEELAIAREAAARLAAPEMHGNSNSNSIPVAVSARHAHLSQPTIDRIFGPGYRLRERAPLSQTGQFAAEETISLVGPRGRLDDVRVMGPPRSRDQIEISRTDEFTLGVDAPVRLSGDLHNTPGITVEGPAGRATLPDGVISARRHIHMSPQDAQRLGVRDRENVRVKIDSEGRDVIFGDVTVRVSPDFELEMHLDTDEANAAGIERGDRGELVEHGRVRGTIGASGSGA